MHGIERNVTLRCPVCGNDQFESLEVNHDDLMNALGTAKLRCSDCGKVHTKEALIEANREALDIAKNEIVADVMKDFEKRWEKAMKRWKK